MPELNIGGAFVKIFSGGSEVPIESLARAGSAESPAILLRVSDALNINHDAFVKLLQKQVTDGKQAIGSSEYNVARSNWTGAREYSLNALDQVAGMRRNLERLPSGNLTEAIRTEIGSVPQSVDSSWETLKNFNRKAGDAFSNVDALLKDYFKR